MQRLWHAFLLLPSVIVLVARWFAASLLWLKHSQVQGQEVLHTWLPTSSFGGHTVCDQTVALTGKWIRGSSQVTVRLGTPPPPSDKFLMSGNRRSAAGLCTGAPLANPFWWQLWRTRNSICLCAGPAPALQRLCAEVRAARTRSHTSKLVII